MPLRAKITRLGEGVELPRYHTAESAAFDLAAAEDKTIAPGEVAAVRTGLVIEAPEGHFLLVAARSSMPKKKGLALANGIGIVDRDFCGPTDEILIQVRNFTPHPVEVKRGERLAQGLFLPVDQVEWEEVEVIRGTDRGGWGSTGGYHTS